MFEQDDAEFAPIGNHGSILFLRTDRDAPNRRIVAVDLRHPDPAAWKTIVPERQQAIENASVAGGRMFVEYLVDVKSRLAMFDLWGKPAGEIALPGRRFVVRLSAGARTRRLIFYAFSSPLYPTTVFAYDIGMRTSTPFEAAKLPVDVGRYETKQLFATSKDGTRDAVLPDGAEGALEGRQQSDHAVRVRRIFGQHAARAIGPTCPRGWSWAASG